MTFPRSIRRVVCFGCDRYFALSKTGRIWGHWIGPAGKQRQCPGSGAYPRETRAASDPIDKKTTNWERIRASFACEGPAGLSYDEVASMLGITEAVAKLDRWPVCPFCHGVNVDEDEHTADCAWSAAFHMVNGR